MIHPGTVEVGIKEIDRGSVWKWIPEWKLEAGGQPIASLELAGYTQVRAEPRLAE